jgi:tetratricopeptide (TPR) repeat protein
MDTEKTFQSALEYYQSENFQKAEEICLEIVTANPEDHNALLLLGMVNFELKEYDPAESYVRDSIRHNRLNPYAFFNLGNILREKGAIDDAVECFKKAIELDPGLPDAYFNLGQISKIKGNTDEAILLYKETIKLNPHYADVHNNLGELYRQKGMLDEAMEFLQNALLIDPDYVPALNNLGMVFFEKGRLEEAVEYLQKALNILPSFSDLYCNMGVILEKMERLEEAVEYLQKAVALNPDYIDAYCHLGIVYKNKGQTEKAIECLETALSKDPQNANVCNNLGMVFEEKRDIDNALYYYQKAIALNPMDPEIHWNLALLMLLSGDFVNGWKKYEWRLVVNDFLNRNFPQPQWDGRLSLKDKRLFIQAEQGIGDEIMFASCLPDIIEKASACVIECDRRLIPLYERSFPSARITEKIEDMSMLTDDIVRADLRIAIGSLPMYFRPDLDGFPERGPYLVPDTQKVRIWQDRLKSLGEGLKVGISWRGGGKSSVRSARSTIPDQWSGIFSLPGIHFINLQYGDCIEELALLKKDTGVTIHNWPDADPLKDLDNFAAQIKALDLVISVDNATVHMAGALGVRAWVLLPFVCDWRWMLDFEDTPWYRTVKLFRQKNSGDWNVVFENVASNLKEYMKTGFMTGMVPQYSYKNRIPCSLNRTNESPSSAVTAIVRKKCRCAVITPVGPGHEDLYNECLASILKSFDTEKGNFSEVMPIRIDDIHGKLGRSRARNHGISKAVEQGFEWIFFIDADDLMAPSAFEYVSPYLDEFDGIWGSIWPIEKGERKPKERPYQLPFLYSIKDVWSCDPSLTLGIGHFVRTSAALSEPFDESLDAGEDFDYYMRVWTKHKCIKIPLPFWYHRRGTHSQGRRSATGTEWRERVEKIIKAYAAR